MSSLANKERIHKEIKKKLFIQNQKHRQETFIILWLLQMKIKNQDSVNNLIY